MNNTRRKFFKQGLAGALLVGTASFVRAGITDPVKPKAPKATNPFRLGMAGYTFVNFDIDKTLNITIYLVSVLIYTDTQIWAYLQYIRAKGLKRTISSFLKIKERRVS